MPSFGPFTRSTHPGAPADHFPPLKNRWRAVDHHGRVTALVADGPTAEERAEALRVLSDMTMDTPADCPFGALAVHHTATDDGAWDGPANEARLDNDDGASVYKLAYAWVDPDKDPDTKVAYRFIHHDVSSDGKPGAANVKACSSGIGVLNGGRGGTTISDTDKKGVYAHLVAHLKDSGVKTEDLPDLDLSTSPDDVVVFTAAEALGYAHDTFSGTHAHAHSAYGSQGGDETHEHEHTHDGDNNHGHTHGMSAQETADDLRSVSDQLTAPTGPLSSPELDTLFAAGADIPQIVDNPGGNWHAYTHVEGIRTDDGREIAMGATQMPDLPVALRYTVADEGGHYGAVTCGRIDTMEMQVLDGITVCYATGVFSTDEVGQNAQLAVEEQTQRFISIDPRDVVGEYVEVQVTTSTSIFDDVDPCGEYDGWFRMTSLVVGAATIVPIPALQQAVIAMADQPLPLAPLATARAQENVGLIAAGAPVQWADVPPAEWFSAPVPTVGDPRLVRQPDGKYAVPMTTTEDGQVFGHACYWGQQHTGFLTRKVTPPRSATYAHYMTGERVVDTGSVDDAGQPVHDRIAVGKITMGTGHPGLEVGATAAKAHYDGGYGAVQVADVRVMEDDFGVWICGALCRQRTEDNPDGPTPSQIAQFMSLDLSPDWRKIAGKLNMLAVLAVPVGGFPVAREALVASGLSAMSEDDQAGVARAGYDGDEIVAMVAAGRVHRMPMIERVAGLERLVDELSRDLTDRRRAAALASLEALTT